MFLKKLQMIGFKSFADSALLELKPGFTAIVGPNGCGKSNISDAIRWALGEQSSKLLRGSKMEDVIFNGTENRKSVGMAEVSLTFTDIKDIAASDFAAYNEVKVTRRLFRSGESEYLINKIPCRLRDVVNLFLDCGISLKNFSIIEQSQVSSIINSKVDHKRLLIENVAGIVKYNTRKNEALRKLEFSEQNLARVNDIINEIKRQVNSLNRQAKKAQRYKNYKSELKDLSLKRFSFEYKELKSELVKFSEKENEFKNSEAEVSLKDSTLKNVIEKEKLELAESERTVNNKKQRLLEIENQIGRNEDKKDMLNAQIDDLGKKKIRLQHEINELTDKLVQLDERIKFQRDKIEECSEEIRQSESSYENKKEYMTDIIDRFNEKQRLLEGLESSLIYIAGKISQKNNILTSLNTRLEILHKSKEKLTLEKNDVKENLASLHVRLEETKSALDESKSRLNELKTLQETVHSALYNNKNTLTDYDNNILSLNEKFTSSQATLNSLVEMQKNYEGFGDGVKFLLKLKNSGDINGLHGVVVDMLETSEKFENAIESVLGERLQSIIVETHEDSINAITSLKRESSGRSSFIPIQPRNIVRNLPDMNGDEGIVDKAINLIQYSEKYKQVLELLLGDVIIVTNFDAGLKIWNKNGRHYTIVTLEGDIIKPSGAIAGGSRTSADDGPLRKKRNIIKREREVSCLHNKLLDLRRERESLYENILSLEKEKEELEIKSHQEDLKISSEKKDLQQIEEELERYKDRLETHDYEYRLLLTEEKEIGEEIAGCKVELDAANIKKEAAESNIKETKDGLKTLQDGSDNFKAEVTRLEVHLASVKGRYENLQMDVEGLLNRKEEISSTIEDRQAEQDESETKKIELLDSIESIKGSILELIEKKRVLEEEITKEEESLNRQDVSLKTRVMESAEVERLLRQIREERSQTALKKSELDIQLQYRIEKITEEFNVNVEDVLGIYKDEDIDSRSLDENISALKDTIIKLGDVNLTALEEYESLNERYNFLTKQADDLKQSIQSLHEAINKINKTTKKLFIETFEKVNVNFHNLFRRLFRGGRAELSLTNPDNILESGVEITAQPPGKKFQNMNLLSAGEKTMTSIALILSAFMVRPSPFCLLDEVDAPLDEANIVRFRNMLTEMTNNTQFIVITHSQKTMSFADILYGVTMEEHGVSKIVSVDLKAVGKKND